MLSNYIIIYESGSIMIETNALIGLFSIEKNYSLRISSTFPEATRTAMCAQLLYLVVVVESLTSVCFQLCKHMVVTG